MIAYRANLMLNPLSANPTKWSNTLKQFVGKLPANCLSVFDHFVGLTLNGLTHFLVRGDITIYPSIFTFKRLTYSP